MCSELSCSFNFNSAVECFLITIKMFFYVCNFKNHVTCTSVLHSTPFLRRSYLGLALALQKDGPGSRSTETIGYLLEAMESLLTENTKAALTVDTGYIFVLLLLFFYFFIFFRIFILLIQ